MCVAPAGFLELVTRSLCAGGTGSRVTVPPGCALCAKRRPALPSLAPFCYLRSRQTRRLAFVDRGPAASLIRRYGSQTP